MFINLCTTYHPCSPKLIYCKILFALLVSVEEAVTLNKQGIVIHKTQENVGKASKTMNPVI